MLVELGGVHEQRHDNDVALGARAVDQREMALVQRAHRRHQPDRAASLGGPARAPPATSPTVRSVLMGLQASTGPIDVEIDKFIWLGPVPWGIPVATGLKHTAQERR